MTQMGQTFKVLSTEALDETVQRFNQSQEETTNFVIEIGFDAETARRTAGRIQEESRDFNTLNAGALFDVKSKAAELLEPNRKTQYETRRLNQLLGRSSQRGAWANPTRQRDERLEASSRHRLRTAGDGDERRRTITSTRLCRQSPNASSSRLTRSSPTTPSSVRWTKRTPTRGASCSPSTPVTCRSHVKTLREKSYWEAVSPSPEFVVCFIPSDFAMSAPSTPIRICCLRGERASRHRRADELAVAVWSVGFMSSTTIAVNAERSPKTRIHYSTNSKCR